MRRNPMKPTSEPSPPPSGPLLFAAVIAAFGGTAFAAMRAMDTGPDAAALRAERAKQQRAHEQRNGNESRLAVGGRGDAAAGSCCDRLGSAAHGRPEPRSSAWTCRDSLALLARYPTKTPKELLQLLDAAVGLSGQVTDRIARLGPASKSDTASPADERALGIPRRRPPGLRVAQKHWNDATVRRMVARDRGDRAIVRALFRQLGAPACADLNPRA